MKLTTLGTGSPLPSPDRAGPANLVQAGEVNLLFDCGRGVTMRLAAAGLIAPQLHQVFLTHLHSDHVTDFNDLVTTAGWPRRFRTPCRSRAPWARRDSPSGRSRCSATTSGTGSPITRT